MNYRKILAFGIGTLVMAQSPIPYPVPQGMQVDVSQPLMNIKKRLQDQYHSPITYEEVPLLYSGDVEPDGNAGDLRGKTQHFLIPFEPDPKADLEQVLNRALGVYQSQGQGPRYRLVKSDFALHLIPEQVRDENGGLNRAVNPLDALISVPRAARTASQHFEAIKTAITKASKIPLRISAGPAPDFEKHFAPLKADPFEWGAQSTSGREALIDFLQRSDAPLTWDMHCKNSIHPANRSCSLDVTYVWEPRIEVLRSFMTSTMTWDGKAAQAEKEGKSQQARELLAVNQRKAGLSDAQMEILREYAPKVEEQSKKGHPAFSRALIREFEVTAGDAAKRILGQREEEQSKPFSVPCGFVPAPIVAPVTTDPVTGAVVPGAGRFIGPGQLPPGTTFNCR